ncbi:MAG: DUF5110 domain-containing protein [Flavobacteriaceae bacterium]|nr:DUF5110 domain-containing protein [Flavobacteriaceae bacterium]
MTQKRFFTVFALVAVLFVNAQTKQGIEKVNSTTVKITHSEGTELIFDFYGNNIFRIFQDNEGGGLRNPKAEPPAEILVKNPRRKVENLTVEKDRGSYVISTDKVLIMYGEDTRLFTVQNKKTGAIVLRSISAFVTTPKKVSWTLKADKDEYFYGGGVQNGRFSHKGKRIAIENQNSWTDAGVASPNPFYWSTKGYAIMWHTFKKGIYDFGTKESNKVTLSHDTDYIDLFVMVDDGAKALLNAFYQLTGNPVLLPKFGFYEGHLNAYNRDYWKENKDGILFEDGKKYKESQKDNGGIKESLNGELNNYQFSARAVIDRYKKYDMPLGWILPNDGYGAGYGQTETLDGNIQNLKSFGEYARENGVEIGLWTQSDLHPKEGVSALLQRDIIKEVQDAGVRVLKTDVAWVGAGYSFGLNGVADVGEIMPKYGDDARPFIISLDGWAGTQRYAGIWSGDQTGGNWEYIRFHIPTYIGSGLSGNPNITSDMDGIFGGKNIPVNVRDFQWKTFTPMQLNMDGWGSNPKYPHILGEPATSINRMYLKMKSELLPYAYSVAHEAVDGLPMIRAMFLEYPNKYTLGKSTQYQFMFGENFLIAPIYQNTKADKEGNDIRNGIYLPDGFWVDYFSGEVFGGNRIINNYEVPIWKLPIFVKMGAIIPMNNPHNNPKEVDNQLRIYELYPYGKSQFTEYDDDGKTQAYLLGKSAKTIITSTLKEDNLLVEISKTVGDFKGFEKNKRTEFKINISKPTKVMSEIGGKKLNLKEVYSLADFDNSENVYFYNENINLNRFATKGSEFEKVEIKKNPQLWVKLQKTNTLKNNVKVKILLEKSNSEVYVADSDLKIELDAVSNAMVKEENRTAYTLLPTWNKVENADYYEIKFNNMLYSTIKDTELLFEDLEPETHYNFEVRAVNQKSISNWTNFSATTKSNPLEFAIKGISATTTCKNQGGQGIEKLFDFDEGNMWHTAWGKKALPFEIVIDLKTINTLDKLHYLPRQSGMNGMLYGGEILVSHDKMKWKKVGDFAWERDTNTKVFKFKNQPTARFVKIKVSKGVGNFGSGREMYIFKVPNTESYIPGDINHDRLLDMNDFTSYLNYTGLRLGDSDFEGYVSKGDLNKNGLIDAYDISVVATQLKGGVTTKSEPKVAGEISLIPNKKSYKKGEMVSITVRGTDLQSVNALSFAMNYNPKEYQFVGIEPLATQKMENMTNDRLHTNGVKALYPTFVNLGNQPTINGTKDLCIIKFKAKENVSFDLKMADVMLVDKSLNVR